MSSDGSFDNAFLAGAAIGVVGVIVSVLTISIPSPTPTPTPDRSNP